MQRTAHLLIPARIMGLERCQDIARLLWQSGQFVSVTSCLVPFVERSIAAHDNFQASPPVWSNLQGTRCGLKSSFCSFREEARQCKHIEPNEILRVVRAQSQSGFERSDCIRCASIGQKRQSQDQMA